MLKISSASSVSRTRTGYLRLTASHRSPVHVRRAFAACEFVTDLHQEYTAIFFCDQIFSFLWSLIRIHVFQFLGSDEIECPPEVSLLPVDICTIPMFHMFDDLENITYGSFSVSTVRSSLEMIFSQSH